MSERNPVGREACRLVNSMKKCAGREGGGYGALKDKAGMALV